MLRKLGEFNGDHSFVTLQNGAKDTCSKSTVMTRKKIAQGHTLREGTRRFQVFISNLCCISSKENTSVFLHGLLIGWKLILLFWDNSFLDSFIKMVFRFIFSFIHCLLMPYFSLPQLYNHLAIFNTAFPTKPSLSFNRYIFISWKLPQ